MDLRTPLIACLLASATIAVPSTAVEFRVDSMVFREQEEEAVCRNTTLFTGSKSYDYLLPSLAEVTIIDTEATTVTILDSSRSLQTVLSFNELANFVQAASARAQNSRAFVKFAAQPDFEISFASEKRLLQMTGKEMEYRVETIAAPDESSAAQFRSFADWTARLNTARPNLPPAARLALNQQLFTHRHLPSRITRNLSTLNGPQQATSRHEYTWSLAENDRRQIAEFDGWAAQFEQVNLHTMLHSQE